MVVSHSSSVSWSNGLSSATPALFTSTSTGPSAAVTAATMATTSASTPTSAGAPCAVIPAARSSSSSTRSREGVRAQTPTWYPARPRAKAMARPIPSVAPVMSAVGMAGR